jgi:hypothetical protein
LLSLIRFNTQIRTVNLVEGASSHDCYDPVVGSTGTDLAAIGSEATNRPTEPATVSADSSVGGGIKFELVVSPQHYRQHQGGTNGSGHAPPAPPAAQSSEASAFDAPTTLAFDAPTTSAFDALLVCTGHYTTPFVPHM